MISPMQTLNLFRSFSVMLTLTVASLSADAQSYTIVHSFAGPPNDGAFANGDLIQDTAGDLYGTTYNGGAFNYGTVFKLDQSGGVTILHSFTGHDGSSPRGGLLR